MTRLGRMSAKLRGMRFGSTLWVALLSAACATLPSAVPLADSSGGVFAAAPSRDRRPRSDAGDTAPRVETDDSDDEVEVRVEPEKTVEPKKEAKVVASPDAGTGCAADAAVTWPGEYFGSDRLTTTFEDLPPQTMTDDKAHTRVEPGSGDRIVISVVDSSKGDVMCALNATVAGTTATLELGQTCFGSGDSAPEILSGSATIECDRLTLDLTAATEIELEDDIRSGEMDYHFEGKRR